MPKAPPTVRLVEPLGHQPLVAGLVRAARDDSLPHALLFEGPEGIGKFRAALWLAATLLCERDGEAPCLACGPCKRVRSGSHADVFVVDHRAHGQDHITVEFISTRETRSASQYQGEPIEQFLTLRSAEGRGKFVIVREAEAMLEQAQNAFLKMLEEPRPGVHLILETSSAASLLATVRSRVVPVRFDALDAATCEAVIREDASFAALRARRAGDAPAGDAPAGGDAAGDAAAGEEGYLHALARMAAGSPGRALRLERRGGPAIRGLLAAAFAGRRSLAETGFELWDVDGDFPGKTAAAQRRARARTILDLGLELLADVERCVAGAPSASLPHGEAAVAAAGGPALAHVSARRDAASAWLSAREDLNLNLSPEGLVDRALGAIGG